MKTLEFLYHAFFGELDASASVMEDENNYTWTSALMHDAAHTDVLAGARTRASRKATPRAPSAAL